MTDAVLLTKIKQGLGIETDYQDDTLMVYIEDVKAFMISAGVPQTTVNSEVSVGCILRGVADLWNYGSGNATFSDYFRMRLTQLALGTGSTPPPPQETSSYNSLTDKPSLNGTTIQGDLESDDVGIDIVESTDIIDLF